MNNLHSNERHLADKLRNVPAPDVDRSWEQMKKLLDRDMPEGAGAGWGGNRKWWWMGITAGVIMLSVWLTQQLTESRDEHLVNKEATNNTAPAQGSSKENITTTDNDKTSSEINDQSTTQTENNNNNSSVKNTTPSATANNTPSQAANTQNQQPTSDKNIQQTTNTVAKDNVSSIHQRDIARSDSKGSDKQNGTDNSVPKVVITPKNDRRTDANKPGATLAATGKNSNSTGSANDRPTSAPASKDILQPQNNTGVASDANVSSDMLLSNDPQSTVNSAEETVALKYAKDAVLEKELPAGPGTSINTAEANSRDAYAIHKKTDRESRRLLRQQYMKDVNRKVCRSNMRGNFGEKDHEITFAAGLTVPQSFAIGGQQSSSYNANARPGRLPDYLPAPFFQYHINPRLFLQTELHFRSPQYTQRLLLSQTNMSSAPTATLQSSVYLEKLYYFNVPFNVYYSPARNLFIGGGLQYSSLLSGVALYEDRRTIGQTQTYSSFARQFKDDSVAAKFAPSEWRYQFDANYYFKRFTLGLRYNQAMRDFINLQVNSTLPPTQDRNQSFLLYLRFSIWEERKKIND